MIGKQHAWPVTIVVVGAMAIVATIGVVLPVWRDHNRPYWTGSEEEVIAGLFDECMQYLQRQRGMTESNTEAQIKGACNCTSQKMYARMKDMSKVEMAEFTKRDSLRENFGSAVKSCIERTGLSPAD